MGAGKSAPVCGERGCPFKMRRFPKFVPFVLPVSGKRNGPCHNFSGVTWSNNSRNSFCSATARLACCSFGSTNCFATVSFSVANLPEVTTSFALHSAVFPSSAVAVTDKSYAPGGFSRSTPSNTSRRSTLGPVDPAGPAGPTFTAQKYTLRSIHFPVTARKAFLLCTCARIRLPWAACGALNRNSSPPPQCGVSAAYAALAHNTSPASTPAFCRFFAILISVAICPSSAPCAFALQPNLSPAAARFLFTSVEEFRCSRCA